MRGAFIGLTTLDSIYLVDRLPAADEKSVARDFTMNAGGPATNAAVTFAYLGGRASLISAIGSSPAASLVRADLARFGVRHVELGVEGVEGAAASGARAFPLPMSAVLVTATTGDRAVVSAYGTVPRCAANTAAATAIADADVVLLDGHQPEAGIQLVRTARDGGPPVLLDGGSWKAGLEHLLPHVDIAVCGAAFRPPDLHPRADVLDYLLASGPFFAAVTDGAAPIRWASADARGIVVPPLAAARDTLGAGDVLHGAFAWMLARGAVATHELVAALADAAAVAARSVQSFGPRAWMT